MECMMENRKVTAVLIVLMVLFSITATVTGILSSNGPGNYNYTSIRGQKVEIYGKGIYQHMSSDVAVQGIAQDYITLFLGIPLLLVSFFLAGKSSLRGKYLLAGTAGYFLVTYLFYLCMAMFNALFLVYVVLLMTSFFTFSQTMLSFRPDELSSHFKPNLPVKLLGGFLIFNAIAIGLLWLSIVLPPLLDGTIYPMALEHYTTLIVQGLDLALLLPLSLLTGYLLIRKRSLGYLLAPVYFIFLSILMTALTAKVIGMTLTGVNAGPALVIIPLFNLTAWICSIAILKHIS